MKCRLKPREFSFIKWTGNNLEQIRLALDLSKQDIKNNSGTLQIKNINYNIKTPINSFVIIKDKEDWDFFTQKNFNKFFEII